MIFNFSHFSHSVRVISAALIVLVLLGTAGILSGCGQAETAEDSAIYFDTTIDIKINGKNAEALLAKCFSLCQEIEDTFSPTKENSELYKINHRTSQTVTVSDDMASCLASALSWCRITDGAFDISIYPVSSLWDFHSENPSLPDSEKLEKALKSVDYTKIHLSGNQLTFDSPDTMIDLGAVTKGFASAKIKEFLKQNGNDSALINLGGNVSTLGVKTDGSEWKIGIQKPFAGRGELLTTISSSNGCVISSGIYERYFELDGTLYHHILSSATGYPVDSELNQATVIGTDDTQCDILSTVCVLLGKEKSEELIKSCGLKVKILYADRENTLSWYSP